MPNTCRICGSPLRVVDDYFCECPTCTVIDDEPEPYYEQPMLLDLPFDDGKD